MIRLSVMLGVLVNAQLCLLFLPHCARPHPWQPAFDACDAQLSNSPHITGDSSDLAWSESYRLLAYDYAYEATRDEKYLDKFVARFNVILAARDDKLGLLDEDHHCVMAAWGGHFKTPCRTCWLCHAAMLAYPVARFCNDVTGDDRYQPIAATYRQELNKTLAAFAGDFHAVADEGYYAQGSIIPGPIPYNQQNTMGCALLEFYRLTGDRGCLDKATRLARYFQRRTWHTRDGALLWYYCDGRTDHCEDVSHAALNVQFICLCTDEHLVFTTSDVQAVCTTYHDYIHVNDAWADTIDGKHLADDQSDYARQLIRWMILPDPMIAHDGEELLEKNVRQSETDLLGYALLMVKSL